jgi:hypothetical protein
MLPRTLAHLGRRSLPLPGVARHSFAVSASVRRAPAPLRIRRDEHHAAMRRSAHPQAACIRPGKEIDRRLSDCAHRDVRRIIRLPVSLRHGRGFRDNKLGGETRTSGYLIHVADRPCFGQCPALDSREQGVQGAAESLALEKGWHTRGLQRTNLATPNCAWDSGFFWFWDTSRANTVE